MPPRQESAIGKVRIRAKVQGRADARDFPYCHADPRLDGLGAGSGYYAADALVNISGAAAIDTFGTSLIADDLVVTSSGELLV